MQEQSLSEIELLIAQLDESVHKFYDARNAELNNLKERLERTLNAEKLKSEQRLILMSKEHEIQIMALETEIGYLKELNTSQRLMMEDNLVYIKGLENKLKGHSRED